MINPVALSFRFKSRAIWLIPCLALLILPSKAAFAQQGNDGRDLPPPPPIKRKIPVGGKVNPPRLANMTIMAPAGCRVWINEVEIDGTKPTLLLNQQRVKTLYSPGGLITLRNLKPGSYRLLARKQD